MKKIFCLFLLLSISLPLAAQQQDSTAGDTTFYIVYIPKYEWSVGIGHGYIPGMFIHEGVYPDNAEISGWISQRFYWQAGGFYLHTISDVTSGDTLLDIPPDTIYKSAYFQAGYALYAGVVMKLFLFKNAYFTPSLGIYYDNFSHNESEDWAITIGPTAAFEYFFNDRFSARVDLFNINIGIGSSGSFPYFTTHLILGLGVRYSFDL